MALETILEFDKNNRYKVKLEVGNVDTSTVGDVELDGEIANLQQEDERVYSFSVREPVSYTHLNELISYMSYFSELGDKSTKNLG